KVCKGQERYANLANTYVDVLLSRSNSFRAAAGSRHARAAGEPSRPGQGGPGRRPGRPEKVPDEARADLQRLTQLETSLSDLQVSREIAENRLSYLKGGRKSGPTGDAAAQQLRERVAQLTAKLERAERRSQTTGPTGW